MAGYGCNPLTGLFVYDWVFGDSGDSCPSSCNPLTGLFVCDFFGRREPPPPSLSCNPLTGLFVCDEEIRAIWGEQGVLAAIPLRGFLFATGDSGCGDELILYELQSPYGAFCLRHLPEEDIARMVEVLQSPYGAFCLRLLGMAALLGQREAQDCNPLTGLFVCDNSSFPPGGTGRMGLQSPYGAFCLRQHTPLIAVL